MAATQTLPEKLENQRLKWLKFNLLGFFLWDGVRILDKYVFTETSLLFFDITQLLGWLIWIISLVQIVRFGKKLKENQEFSQILNDELVVFHRFKSWKIGFICMLLIQGIILSFSLFYSLSATFGAELSIFTGVVSAMGAFIYYHRD